jgi:hypothetical protein
MPTSSGIVPTAIDPANPDVLPGGVTQTCVHGGFMLILD